MNTKIEFVYRDGANYKTYNTAVVAGEYTQEQVATILDCCYKEEIVPDNETILFIPEQVGLSAERWNEFNPELDGLWCELGEYSFSSTAAKPTEAITMEELVRNFQAAKGNWDDDIEAYNGTESD